MDARTPTRSLTLSSNFILKYLRTPNDISLRFCIVRVTQTYSACSLHQLHKPNAQPRSSVWFSVCLIILKRISIAFSVGNLSYCYVFQWLRRRFGLVNRFIGSSLVVTTFSSFILQITVTIAHVTPRTKSSDSSSCHTSVPLELRN
jgi:hypothetical protein